MPLENYVENCKRLTNEEAVVSLVKEVIEHPQIYVFGELLELANVRALKQSPNATQWYNLLELFAYGKLSDYNEHTMPALTDLMIKKLRILTIVTLATNKTKKVAYSVLSDELKVSHLRDLEDLIIEAIYSNLIKGKLDQKAICLEVESTLARDVKVERIDDISSVLANWITNCDNILNNIEKQSRNANSIKSDNLSKKVALEEYVSHIKKTIKTNNQEMEDAWDMNLRDSQVNSMQHEYEKSRRAPYKQSRFSLKTRNHHRF